MKAKPSGKTAAVSGTAAGGAPRRATGPGPATRARNRFALPEDQTNAASRVIEVEFQPTAHTAAGEELDNLDEDTAGVPIPQADQDQNVTGEAAQETEAAPAHSHCQDHVAALLDGHRHLYEERVKKIEEFAR
ncbi:hypothetical protein JX266_014514, partial [Neoarthrinium moseri]